MRSLTTALFVTLLGSTAAAQTALDTTFTYQGLLNKSGTPTTDTCDLEFDLFDALNSGSQVGSTVTKSSVSVTNGLFTVQLDFGSQFDGNKRWIEIGVQCSGDGGFTTLAPRQELTVSPHSLYSLSAATVAGLSCADGQVAKWSGSTWTCGTDIDTDTNSGGTVTSVTAGSGLSGGTITGSGTLSADTAVVQARVTGTCPAGQSIRVVNSNGMVACQAGPQVFRFQGFGGTVTSSGRCTSSLAQRSS